jgi:hypothetical protein
MIPEVPSGLHMPASAEFAFTVYQAIPIAIFVIYAARVWRRERDVLPFLFLLGGAACVLIEPIVDNLGLCDFPVEGQRWTQLAVLNRHIPLFVGEAYTWYVGGQAYLIYRLLKKGTPGPVLWRCYFIFAVANFALEVPGLQIDAYTYYGNQPFWVLGFPLWWAFVNPLMPMTFAVAVYRMRHRLVGWMALGVVVLAPMADAVANAAAGWPVWLALNSGKGYFVTYLGGTGTILLALMTMGIIVGIAREPVATTDTEPTLPSTSVPETPGTLPVPTPVS